MRSGERKSTIKERRFDGGGIFVFFSCFLKKEKRISKLFSLVREPRLHMGN